MPTTTPEFGIVKPTSGAEPADMYGVSTRLADSTETALVALDTVDSTLLARSSTQAITTATDTLVLWNTTTNIGTGYGVLWTQSAGTVTMLADAVVDVSAYVDWAGPATPAGYRYTYLYANIAAIGGGNVFYDGMLHMAVTTASTVTRQKYPPTLLDLAAGDTFELHVGHNHGSSVNINAATKMRVTLRGR
jgi:hypothetical protein